MRKVVFAPIWALPRMRLDYTMAGIIFRSRGAVDVPTPDGSMPYPVETISTMASTIQFFIDDVRSPELGGAMNASEARLVVATLDNLAHYNTLVVACEVGVSRSASVAIFCNERFGADIESYTAIDTDGANLHMLEMLRAVSSESQKSPSPQTS